MTVNNYILDKILRERTADIPETEYRAVISQLEVGYYVDDICKYILSAGRKTCLERYGVLSFAQLLRLLDSKFCVEKAYEYVRFLQNNHEYLEEIESLKR